MDSEQSSLLENGEEAKPIGQNKFKNVTFARLLKNSACFTNPWESWKNFSTGPSKLIPFMLGLNADANYSPRADDPEVNASLPVKKPIFQSTKKSAIRLTWFGHASVLCQMENVGILCDPVFSHRCSATQLFGPARYRPAPCQISEIPQGLIDVVVISHNHYDHMDMNSIRDLAVHHSNAVWCVPMGDKDKVSHHLEQNRAKNSATPIVVKEFLWWEQISLKELCPSAKADVQITFTPTQHWSGRNIVWDKNKALWGSWAFKTARHSFWFAGDTGYCPVFKEIGDQLGPFDAAAIPIGAYHPRDFLRAQHVDPAEAVQIHKDVRAKKSLAIHWGTFALANENYLRPKTDLQEAISKAGLSATNDFVTICHGESLCIPENQQEHHFIE